ncbi:MAG: fatty acid desaturase [Pantoea agglomerans]|nr:fatty acid desaturase [Pantoea agglomerans]
MHTGYLSLQQRAWLKARARSWLWRSELPTWLLIGVIYGGWFAVMLNAQTLGRLPATLLLIGFTGWYMSLQHELIHGHPTRWPRVNQLFGTLPLAVWYPYGLYRDSHLAHHRNHTLTDAARWAKLPRWQQQLIHLRNTFLGRLLLGPLLDVAATFGGMWQALRRGDRSAIAMWLLHGALLALLFFWMARQGFSPLWYLPLARSVNNEAAWPWRMLFLNLNYHSVHHDLPGVPWYGLRRLYLRDREHYYQRNHGFRVAGYRVWLRQFWVRPVGVNVHPGRSAEKTHE